MKAQEKNLNEVLAGWKDWLEVSQRHATNTVESYARDVKDFLHFLLGYLNQECIDFEVLSTIDHACIRAWLTKKRLSAKSNSRFISSLRSFYKYLAQAHKVENAAPQTLIVHSGNLSLPRSITRADVLSLIDSMPIKNWTDKRDKAVISLLYGCGLRISEALAIRCADIEGNMVKIHGKGSKERMVPLIKEVTTAIEEYMSSCPFTINDLIFLGLRGAQLSRTFMAKRIANIRAEMGLGAEITAHGFRHSCATHLLENSVDINTIKELLGHSDIKSTEIYTKLDTRTLARIYESHHPRNKKNNE